VYLAEAARYATGGDRRDWNRNGKHTKHSARTASHLRLAVILLPYGMATSGGPQPSP